MPFKSDKQRKWMWANDPEMAQEWEDEEKLEEEEVNPKMSKKDLVEYINFKTKGGVKKFKLGELVKEQNPPRYGQGNGPYDFPYLNEVTPQERRDIMKYFEMIRQSGIVNMFGAHPILNWTKDDLHRFLYGERNDPESIEREIEEEEYDNEDGENDNTISILEDKLEKINYLLDNKRKMRDILIRAALNRIENTDGNHETRNVQRIFEKMAKEAWHFWVGIQQI
jgi:hypothetical protein